MQTAAAAQEKTPVASKRWGRGVSERQAVSTMPAVGRGGLLALRRACGGMCWFTGISGGVEVGSSSTAEANVQKSALRRLR